MEQSDLPVSIGMTPPTVLAGVVVVFLEGFHGIIEGGIGGDPFLDIGEVGGGVAVLRIIAEADGAPEGLDVAEHLAAERPEAGHPVAIPAPEEIGAGEAVVFVAGEIDPLRLAVGWELREPCDERVNEDLAETHNGESECGRGGGEEGEVITHGAEHSALGGSESVAFFPADEAVGVAEDLDGEKLREDGGEDSSPSIKAAARDPWEPGKETDDDVE